MYTSVFANIGIGLICFLALAILYYFTDKIHNRVGRPIGKIVLGAVIGIALFASCGQLVKESAPKYFETEKAE